MAYKTATICFWSGTGNSYRVSNWLGKIADNRGLKTRIISLEKAKSEKLLSAGKESFIAIVFLAKENEKIIGVMRMKSCIGKVIDDTDAVIPVLGSYMKKI